MATLNKTLPAYEVEFIPLERRLLARRKTDRDPRSAKLSLAYPNERRQQQRREAA